MVVGLVIDDDGDDSDAEELSPEHAATTRRNTHRTLARRTIRTKFQPSGPNPTYQQKPRLRISAHMGSL